MPIFELDEGNLVPFRRQAELAGVPTASPGYQGLIKDQPLMTGQPAETAVEPHGEPALPLDVPRAFQD